MNITPTSHRLKFWLTVVSICCVLGLANPAAAIDWKLFKDSEDGALDLSD